MLLRNNVNLEQCSLFHNIGFKVEFMQLRCTIIFCFAKLLDYNINEFKKFLDELVVLSVQLVFDCSNLVFRCSFTSVNFDSHFSHSQHYLVC